jgi:SAM-dependent methyltransferase
MMNLRHTNGTLARHLFSGQQEPVVVELGTGTGNLSGKVKEVFHEMTPAGVDWRGIEFDPAFAAMSQHRMRGNTGAVVMPGDAFVDAAAIKEKLQLQENPDIVFASHSLMYSPNLPSTMAAIKDLLKKPNSFGLLINLHPRGDQVTLTKGFAEDMGQNVNKNAVQIMEASKMPYKSITFRAHITFPEISEALWAELQEAKPYDDHTNPHAAHENGLAARKLIEFVLQRPLEALSADDRASFLDRVKKKLHTQNNNLFIDSIIQVVASPEIKRKDWLTLESAAISTHKACAPSKGL